MREIKFRFWDGTTGNMAMCYQNEEGTFIYPSSNYPLSFHTAWKEANETEGYNKPKSLMQSTGLKDKNWKEIYEGDLVRIRQQGADPRPRVIVYHENIAAFAMSKDKTGVPSLGIGGYILEVIGNIYQNPELLTDLDNSNNSNKEMQ